ncbi:hypothetical protein KW798_03690 [Candidatus Parcubacteria bacterium]|nr:hypothetical protein [Candidatus Parcubacteria bacterium]
MNIQDEFDCLKANENAHRYLDQAQAAVDKIPALRRRMNILCGFLIGTLVLAGCMAPFFLR